MPSMVVNLSDRHRRVVADHLEVREGARRYSADFFHTRSSTCASPSAAFNSSTSASSASSREDGRLAPPAASPARPDSRNCCFHFPTEVSDTLFRRAASARVISPASTDNTIRVLSSTGNTGGRLITGLLQDQRSQLTPEPQSLTRDRRPAGPAVVVAVRWSGVAVARG